MSRGAHRGPRSSSPLTVLGAGLAGSLALAGTVTGSLSAFTAGITNTSNTASSGYVRITETLLAADGTPTSTVCTSTDGTTLADNTATCATIDKYGGTTTPLRPGGPANTTTVAIQNSGTAEAVSLTLGFGACTATAETLNGGATNPCQKFLVSVTAKDSTNTSYTVVPPTAATALPTSLSLLPMLGSRTGMGVKETFRFTIRVELDPSADNTYGGFDIRQPLTWTLTG